MSVQQIPTEKEIRRGPRKANTPIGFSDDDFGTEKLRDARWHAERSLSSNGDKQQMIRRLVLFEFHRAFSRKTLRTSILTHLTLSFH